MNARTAVAALAVLSALTLTGCAGGVESPAGESARPAVTESVEPLVAETGEPSAEDLESAFLNEVRDRLGKIRTQIPDATDEQLVALAHEACDRIKAGTSGEDMTLIEGEERTNGYYMDTAAISTSAALTICPRS